MTLEEYGEHLEEQTKSKQQGAKVKRAEAVSSNMSQGSIPVSSAPSLKKDRGLEDVKEEFSDASSSKSTIIDNEANHKQEIKEAQKKLSNLKKITKKLFVVMPQHQKAQQF